MEALCASKTLRKCSDSEPNALLFVQWKQVAFWAKNCALPEPSIIFTFFNEA